MPFVFKQLLASRRCWYSFHTEVNFVVPLFQHIIADFQFVIKQFGCFEIWLSELQTCSFRCLCCDLQILSISGSQAVSVQWHCVTLISLLSVTMQWSIKNMLSILWFIAVHCIYLHLEYVSRGKNIPINSHTILRPRGFQTQTIRAVWCLIKYWGL